MAYGFPDRLSGGRSRTQFTIAAILAALLLVGLPYGIPFLLPGGLGGFQMSLLTRTLIFVLFATAFNLLYGYTGLLSFGHAMFIAVAGYTVAKTVSQVAPALGLIETFGGTGWLVTWVLALVLGMLMATLLAVFVGYLSVQLEEIYFALITLAFSMAIFVMANQDTPGTILQALGIGDGNFTNRSDGLTFIMGDVDLFGVIEFQLVDIVNPFGYYFLTLLVVSLGMYAIWRVVRSPFGLVCKAIRENPDRARALGIDVTFHQWMTFIVSGAFSGLAGALLIPLATNVNPESHAFWTASADPVIMTVIGGPYSFFGPAIGAFTYEYLRWFIRQFPVLEAHWEASFGLLLLIVVMFFSNGVSGGVNRGRAWLSEAADRFREDGAAGVGQFVRETVVGHVTWARDAVVGWVKDRVTGLRRLVGSGAG
ncbi:branched-chain amino acid ABC transporter permease [Salinirussus salinus]|jgi:branched-chain amino acid transport system permease protein|uniref:branched-chain amino acid ABC transporter permease n=1 Tax=Salinirussus salinus TaxID=1198300 RepID=UPI00135C8A25|nr:branched-chain amino acid ABC transporter permease [Salinirussus salinus]